MAARDADEKSADGGAASGDLERGGGAVPSPGPQDDDAAAGAHAAPPGSTDTSSRGPPDGAGPPAKSLEEPEAGRTRLQTWLIMMALCSALFLAALDVTIVATAVPTIVQEFASPVGYTWVGSAYLLANASLVPSWGKLSDIFGRKVMLLVAVAVFWLGSLICALSINMGMLIAARAIQGAGGGGIVVLVNICISDLFSMRSRGVYYGVLGMVWALASAIGPILVRPFPPFRLGPRVQSAGLVFYTLLTVDGRAACSPTK